MALNDFICVTNGPSEMDISLHFVGRKMNVDFKLSLRDRTKESYLAGWYFECGITEVHLYLSGNPNERPTLETAPPDRAHLEFTFVTELTNENEPHEIRIRYNFHKRVGDVLSIRLNNGTLITEPQ